MRNNYNNITILWWKKEHSWLKGGAGETSASPDKISKKTKNKNFSYELVTSSKGMPFKFEAFWSLLYIWVRSNPTKVVQHCQLQFFYSHLLWYHANQCRKNTFMALLIITMHSIAIYILSHVFLSPKKVITFVITLYPVSFSLKITKLLPWS